MAASLIVGCDPGVSGAVAFLTPEGELLAVEDLPVDTVKVGKHSRSKIAVPRLLSMLSGSAGARFVVEEPEFRPMNRRNPRTGEVETSMMGVAKAGAFGITYGYIVASAIASGCSLLEVRAREWKNALRLHGDKDDSRRMASNLFPAHSALFARKSDDGRAESCLIGLYGTSLISGAVRQKVQTYAAR